jgi:hypothetical protein
MSESLMYVSFEEYTGKILGISPKQQGNNSLPVSLSEVIEILEGKQPKRNYRVGFNAKKKQLELIHQIVNPLDAADVNNFIYEIPENNNIESDLTITQDVQENCWKIQLGNELKNNLENKKIKLNQIFFFSVTKKHDPNILYKSITVDFSQAIEDDSVIIPFTMEFEKNDTPFSIFTAKIFDTYSLQRCTNE